MADPIVVQYKWGSPADFGLASSQGITEYSNQINVPVNPPPFPGGNIILIAQEINFADGAVLDVSGAPGNVPARFLPGIILATTERRAIRV